MSDGSRSNLIGLHDGYTLAQFLATDTNGNPLLADNGGPTRTIALATGNPAMGAALATLTSGIDANMTSFTVDDATFLAVGDALKVDSEIMIVTGISGAPVTVTRGQDGTTAERHAADAGLFLAFDQRGLPRNANPDIGAFETQVPTVEVNIAPTTVYNGSAVSVKTDVVGTGRTDIVSARDPAISYSYYPGTRTAGPLAGAPVDAGSYAVVATFTSDVPGYRDATSGLIPFTIDPRPVTVTADAQTKAVGGQNPPLTYQMTSGSLVPGDSLKGDLTRDAGETAGSYAISKGSLTAGPNYDLTFVPSATTHNC